MTPAEMQALWKEVQQVQALQAGAGGGGHAPGGEDAPKPGPGVANGLPTPPSAGPQQVPGAGHVINGVAESFLSASKFCNTSPGVSACVFCTQ